MKLAEIGRIHSCFDEKFGTPRQPGLAPATAAELVLVPPFDAPEVLRGLEGCSHVWLLFGFHLNVANGWSPTVRPPRLGGNRRMGVFATRSPFRPNPVGLSAVTLEGILDDGTRRGLLLGNHDLVDGTPVYDVKPYVPYSDALPEARPPAGFDQAPGRAPVCFSEAAERALREAPTELRRLIVDVLSLDPRPAYRRGEEGRMHGVTLAGHNVRWYARSGSFVVEEVWPG